MEQFTDRELIYMIIGFGIGWIITPHLEWAVNYLKLKRGKQ